MSTNKTIARLAADQEGLRDDDRCGFNRGIAYAVALLVDTWDEPGMAAHVIRESGVTLADFEMSGADETDIGAVRRVFATEIR